MNSKRCIKKNSWPNLRFYLPRGAEGNYQYFIQDSRHQVEVRTWHLRIKMRALTDDEPTYSALVQKKKSV
jgi:hypothetical protein